MEQSEFNKEFGKYILDISKLIFGGTVLASILKIETINHLFVMIAGFVIAGIAALIGLRVIRKK